MSDTNRTNSLIPDELAWRAFQYVSGDLSPAESDDFERCLADDQDAREAVAQAVELGTTLASALEHPVVVATRSTKSHSLRWARRLAWMGAGAAVCLVLLVPLSRLAPSRAELALNFPSSAETGQLALVWAQAHSHDQAGDALAPADVAGNGPGDGVGGEMADMESDSPRFSIDMDDGDRLAAPSWMLTAVEGLCGELAAPGLSTEAPIGIDREGLE